MSRLDRLVWEEGGVVDKEARCQWVWEQCLVLLITVMGEAGDTGIRCQCRCRAGLDSLEEGQ